jgi:peptidoglycan/LPS O-acetylase OafA/YrhL
MSLNVPSTEHGLLDHLARLGFAFCLGAMFWVCRSKLLISPFILIGLGVLAFALHNSFLSLPLMVSFTGYATLVVGAMHFGALSRITRRNDLSYGMYIMGFPAQQALMLFFPNITGVLNGLLAMVIVMPMAYLSWHYVEKPALRLKSRFDRKNAPQIAEPLGE